MSLRWLAGSLAAFILASGPVAAAQEPEGPQEPGPSQVTPLDDAFLMLEILPPDVQEDVQDARNLLQMDGALLATGNRDRYLSAISDLYKPVTNRAVKVCFKGQVTAVRKRIADAARGWQVPGSSLTFDFGENGQYRDCAAGVLSDVRIGFNGRGNWSLIGREADMVRQSTRMTMNFDSQSDWKAMDADQLRRIVQHEFGHAIGLYHEHQNPRANCTAQLRWDKIVEVFGGPEYNLTEEYLRANFTAQLKAEASVIASKFDEYSIMLYFLPAEILVGGKDSTCWHEENTKISKDDMAAVRRSFPASERRMLSLRYRAYATLQEAVSDPEIPADLRPDLKLAADALYPFGDAAQRQLHLDAVQALTSRR